MRGVAEQQHTAAAPHRQTGHIVRRDHPRVRRKLTPKLFNELSHINVEVVLGRTGVGHRLAEQHWRRAGLDRRVRVTVPYFTTAAMIASRTDCIAGLPSRLAEVLCGPLPLKVVATTFPLPKMGLSLVWHERTDADPGCRYFRELVVEAVCDGRAARGSNFAAR